MGYKIFLVLSAACVFAATPAPVNDAGKAGLDAERLARIPVRMKHFVDRGDVAGVVTLTARHGVIAQFDAVGAQDVERKVPMSTNTIFQIMSMTKPVTGVAIMMLMEEGKLALNDPVERHLPEFRGQMVVEKREADGSVALRKPARPITIRDLMTHTSGLFDALPASIQEHNQTMNMTLADAMKVFSQQPLEFEPGSKWMYSSPGIGVLGRIVEVASGQSYEEFLTEHLFRPLGMKDSFFFPPEEKTRRIAMVYHAVDGKLVRAGNEILGGDPARYRKGARYPAPEWGLYSTASDLFAFYQMMLNNGTLNGRRYLSHPAVELMTQLETGNLPRAGWIGGGGYGLTWEVIQDWPGTLLLHSPGTYGHGGAFGTQGWIDPKRDLIRILLVQNSDGLARDASNAFMAMAASAIVE